MKCLSKFVVVLGCVLFLPVILIHVICYMYLDKLSIMFLSVVATLVIFPMGDQVDYFRYIVYYLNIIMNLICCIGIPDFGY